MIDAQVDSIPLGAVTQPRCCKPVIDAQVDWEPDVHAPHHGCCKPVIDAQVDLIQNNQFLEIAVVSR